ncbi:Ferredoxin [uncultured archaeon]|nr:Ferredoxin [uncultured archaeon]
MVKIKIDTEKCIGCGLCFNICPQVFAMGKDGKAFVKAQKDISCVKEALESCPVSAISE